MRSTPASPNSNPTNLRRLKLSFPSKSAMTKANMGIALSNSDMIPEGKCTAA